MELNPEVSNNRISEEKHSVILDRLMKSGIIATTAFELIRGGFEFYSQASDIQNAVEKEMNLSESSYVQYAERGSSNVADALKNFDIMIPDEGDLQDVMNTQYEKNKEESDLLWEERRRKPGMYISPGKKDGNE